MTTHIFLLLDMTGSMFAGKEMTMDACNEFISGQKSNYGGGDSIFTLGVFNSNVGLERVARKVPLEKAPMIDLEHYRPDGGTPLYDAIGEAMDILESDEGQVLFIIQTDGQENCSQRVTRDQVIQRVAEKTAAGWQFVYLGCDIDAMTEGEVIGIPSGNTLSYARGNTKQAFNTLGRSARAYRETGSTSSKAFFIREKE